MNLALRLLRLFALLALPTIFFMALYATVQQSYRQGANDPQIQIAEDAAAKLAAGASVDSVIPRDTVDIATSLAPFVAVYNVAGTPLASNARLDSEAVNPPDGVLGHAAEFGTNRVTWQPRRGVRSALIAIRVPDDSGRVVVSGRSLRETENRVSRLSFATAAAWFVSMAIVALYWLLGFWDRRA